MKYILVNWSKGITQIRSAPETGVEDALTEQEQIINELHTKLKKLTASIAVNSLSDLDGKIIPVKFKVSKFIPKISIDILI